jgi:hypothetical protein
MRGRTLLPVVALAAFATMAAACLSPTLPLPPPDMPEDVGEGSTDGLWEVSGTCAPGATVFVTNTTTTRGVFVTDTAGLGLYQVSLPGKACDLASVTQSSAPTEDDGSSPTFFVLEAFANGMVTDPQACQ